MAELWDRCRTQFHVIYHNYQQAAAGTGIMLEAEDSGEPVFIRNTWLSDRADEIVTVNGASMEPDFHDGQDVYVEHTPDLEIGEIGLFVINGDGFIKQYQGDHLHSLKPVLSVGSLALWKRVIIPLVKSKPCWQRYREKRKSKDRV